MVPGILEHGSYLGIIAILVLTGCGLPVPEEVAIIAAGVLSKTGDLNPWLALGSCLIGALLGDCVMYYIGRRFGRSVLRDHPRWVGFMTPEREKRIEQMIRRHGIKLFFVNRFLVGLRSPVYVTAGILRVPFHRFLLIDFFCASAVIGLFFGLSYFFGDAIGRWIRQAEVGVTVIVVGAVVIALGLYWRHHRRLAQAEMKAVEKVVDPAAPPLAGIESEAAALDESKNVA